MNKNIILPIVSALAILVAVTALITPKSSESTEISVTTPVLPVSAGTNTSNSTKKKILNLNLEPENVVVFNNEVDSYSVEDTIRRIQENERNGEDLYIILDCPGGSVFEGARLISYMESAKIKVNTVVYGMAASMCAHIHAHGAKRYVLDRSTLMYHQASGGVQGPVKGMKNLLGYVDRTVQKLDAYIADRAGMSRQQFDSLVSVDFWIDGEDAVNMGLADALVTVTVRNARLFGPTEAEDSIVNQQKEITSVIETNPLETFR